MLAGGKAMVPSAMLVALFKTVFAAVLTVLLPTMFVAELAAVPVAVLVAFNELPAARIASPVVTVFEVCKESFIIKLDDVVTNGKCKDVAIVVAVLSSSTEAIELVANCTPVTEVVLLVEAQLDVAVVVVAAAIDVEDPADRKSAVEAGSTLADGVHLPPSTVELCGLQTAIMLAAAKLGEMSTPDSDPVGLLVAEALSSTTFATSVFGFCLVSWGVSAGVGFVCCGIWTDSFSFWNSEGGTRTANLEPMIGGVGPSGMSSFCAGNSVAAVSPNVPGADKSPDGPGSQSIGREIDSSDFILCSSALVFLSLSLIQQQRLMLAI